MSRAAQVAPLIDDAAIIVYRSVSDEDRYRLREAIAGLGLESIAYWGDLSEFLLEGKLTDEIVRLRYRYSESDAFAEIQRMQELGLLDAGLNPSSDLVSVLRLVVQIRGDTAVRLWQNCDIELALSIATAPLESATGPLVESYLDLAEPDRPEARLHHRLVGLRYLRADAHEAAWQAAGLSAGEIVVLTREWHDGSLTGERLAVRERIEEVTNRNCFEVFAWIGDPPWGDWVDALRLLVTERG